MRELDIAESQQVALEILKIVTDICEENSLRYFLIYGTLIGAVRHDGFIPWDDDIDIMMPRPDYDKLMTIFQQGIPEYSYLKVFNHDVCEEYPYMITRISDQRYKIIMDNEKEYGMGLFIDIYPYDGLGDTEKEALRYGLKGDRLSSLCYQSTRCHYAIETTTSIVRRILKFPVFLYSKIRGKNGFQKKLKKLERLIDYDKSNYVGCVVWLSGGMKDIFPRNWFDKYCMKQFDKYQFRIPQEYDKILTHIYGDYMKLPPKEQQIGHHNYSVYEL